MLKRVLGYAAYMLGAGAVTSLLSLAVDALGMVTKPKETYGDYHIYLLVAMIGSSVCTYGINGAIQKYAASNEVNRRRIAGLSIKSFLALQAAAAVVALGIGVFYRWNVAIAVFVLPSLVMFWWGRYVVRTALNPKFEARIVVFGSLAKTFCIGGFLTFTELRDAMIYGDAIATIGVGLFSLVTIPRALSSSLSALLKEVTPRELLVEMFVFVRPLWAGGMVFLVGDQTQPVFTAASMGSAPMGALGALRSLWQLSVRPMDLLGHAMLPGLVAEEDDRPKMYRDALRLCLVAFPLIGVSVAGGMPLVLQILSIDEKYAEIPMLLVILCSTVPSSAVQMIVHQYSIAEGYPQLTFWSHLWSMIATLGAVYPLSLYFGLNGIVATTWITVSVSAVVLVVGMWKTHFEQMRLAVGWWALSQVGTVLALVVVYRIDSWLAAFPAAAVYILSCVVFRLLRVSDFVAVKTAFLERKRRSSVPA